MSRRCILAIDQGTTNTKALVFDETGDVRARAIVPVDVRFPQPGWVEQDPDALWRTVALAIERCLAEPGMTADLAAVAVTNQRESAIAWDAATGHPVGPCIVWQCRRTAAFCAALAASGAEPLVHRKTGLTIDPLFSASKFRWLLDRVEDGHARAAQGDIRVGTVDSWVLWQLTGGKVHATDATNASRTQLLALETVEWDDELLSIFGVPRAALPAVRASSGVFGETIGIGPLPGGVPIAGVAGDSHAAFFGHAPFHGAAVKATYGTGSSLMTELPTPSLSNHGLSTTIAWALSGGARYALEGNITTTGGAVDWLSRTFGDQIAPEHVAAFADTVESSEGVYLVPAFAGLGAPYWDPDARGVITGLTRGTTRAHLARATIESIAYQVRDVFDAMTEDVGRPLPLLLADGGASHNDALMQFQADILGCPVARSRSTDLTARGAAWLAGLAIGLWRSTDVLAALPRPVDRFDPRMPADARERRYGGWRDAVARARSRRDTTATPVPDL